MTVIDPDDGLHQGMLELENKLGVAGFLKALEAPSLEDKLFARMLGRGAPRLPIVPDPEPRRNPEGE